MFLRFAIVVLATFTFLPCARCEEPKIPQRLKPFQGKWLVKSIHVGSQAKELADPIRIEVIGQKFFIRSADDALLRDQGLPFSICDNDGPTFYDRLKESAGPDLGELANIKNQIYVFWFIGLYRFVDGELELVLTYCGQGLEGEQFRQFRPPTDFERRDDESQTHILLRREQAIKPPDSK